MFFKNYFSALILIFFGYFFYSNVGYYTGFFDRIFEINLFGKNFSTDIYNVFKIIILIFSVALIPFYVSLGKIKGKSWLVIEYIFLLIKGKYSKIEKEHKIAFLAFLVKFFFVPLMIFWFFENFANLKHHFGILWESGFLKAFSQAEIYYNHTFFVFLYFFLFVDTIFFTAGYLIEHPKLKNTIKSVEPTAIGWFFALASYPPFNIVTSNILGWYSSDFPYFENKTIGIIASVFVLVLMGMYASASVSLGWKASNLTNRGIVKTGLYKYVRHPAYACKNLAWFIGAMPFLCKMFMEGNFGGFFVGLCSVLAWIFIYFMRAKTEEAHLSQDEEYKKYMQEVPYRFIPKVW